MMRVLCRRSEAGEIHRTETLGNPQDWGWGDPQYCDWEDTQDWGWGARREKDMGISD